MGKTRKLMVAFIDDIPNSKLEGGIPSDTIYTDNKNFRLDNQGTTTAKDGKPVCYNIQMQINKYPEIISLTKAAPSSVAKIQMPVDEPWTAAKIKEELKKSLIAHGDANGQF